MGRGLFGDGEKNHQNERTESIAVGNRSFIEKVKALFGFRAKGREIKEGGEGYQLKGGPAPYNALFEAEKKNIGYEDTYYWDSNLQISVSCRGPNPFNKMSQTSKSVNYLLQNRFSIDRIIFKL
jgi:hypothetical protein